MRTVFLSDLHLGAAHSQARELLSFLENLHCEKLFLVGDIVDLWWLTKRRARNYKSVTQALELIRKLPARGIEVVYIPGNHDAPMRSLGGHLLAGIQVVRRAVHTLPDGRRLLITHGDQFDRDVQFNRTQKACGDALYEVLLGADRLCNSARQAVGLPRASMTSWLKGHNGKALDYVQRYEAVAVSYARQRGFDGVLCGHVHSPQLKLDQGTVYANCGDWVENLSAIGETADGQLQQIRWANSGMRSSVLLNSGALAKAA